MLLICAASSGKNLNLAHRLQALAQEQNIEAEVLDLTEVGLPLYSPQAEAAGEPETFATVHAQFERASAYFMVAPEYNGSIPPTLTNTIAWLSVASSDFRRLFNGQPTALATHSGGGGTKVTMAMRLQMAHLGANVLGRELVTNSKKQLNEGSAVAILNQLAQLMG
ncbi:MAG: NADPH-dependent oxidoreductase [Deltaproteobacteria bacterium]|nr:NADPH-dependent oxidoreductase [Deltaproteobacteria bacterium]